MNVSKILSVTVLCILMSFSANAQERAKKRAENRANQRIDQKVDQAVDKTADAIEGLFRRKKRDTTPSPNDTIPNRDDTNNERVDPDSEGQGGFLSGLTIGGEFEPYENQVLMNLSLDMTTIDKRGKEQSATVHYTFDRWATGMNMISDEGTARIILDNQEGFMTIISEDDGETQGMRMRQPRVDFESIMPDQSEYTVTNLGNTRQIDGYNCVEYRIDHPDGITNAWMTTELDIDRDAIIRAMASQMRRNKNNSSQGFFEVEGFPIESTTVSKNGKETVKTRYYNLKFGADIDRSVFDTNGIEIMNMGF